MKIPAKAVIFHTPCRPIPYTDEEEIQLIRHILRLPIEPPLPPTERQFLDVWLQHLLPHTGHPFALPQTFTVPQLTEALKDWFGETRQNHKITDHSTMSMLNLFFAASPTINFRQLKLTLERHDDTGCVALKVEHHPVEWERLFRFAWRLAGMTFEEASGNEHQQSEAA